MKSGFGENMISQYVAVYYEQRLIINVYPEKVTINDGCSEGVTVSHENCRILFDRLNPLTNKYNSIAPSDQERKISLEGDSQNFLVSVTLGAKGLLISDALEFEYVVVTPLIANFLNYIKKIRD